MGGGGNLVRGMEVGGPSKYLSLLNLPSKRDGWPAGRAHVPPPPISPHPAEMHSLTTNILPSSGGVFRNLKFIYFESLINFEFSFSLLSPTTARFFFDMEIRELQPLVARRTASKEWRIFSENKKRGRSSMHCYEGLSWATYRRLGAFQFQNTSV